MVEARSRAALQREERGRKQMPTRHQLYSYFSADAHQESPAEQKSIVEYSLRTQLPHDEAHAPNHQSREPSTVSR